MKDYELLEQQVRVMKMAEKHGIDDWRKLVKVLHSGNYVDLSVNHVFNHNYTYRFALGVVEGKPVFEGDVLWIGDKQVTAKHREDSIGWMTCADGLHRNTKKMTWTPPKKTEPTSRGWRDVYRWMQEQGVRFECLSDKGNWYSGDWDFVCFREEYRIDLSQTPPDNWREIYRTAQELGVFFSHQGGADGVHHSFCDHFTDYQLATAKRRSPRRGR